MKRLLLLVVLVLCLNVNAAYAFRQTTATVEGATSSGELSADATVIGRSAKLWGVLIITDGTNSATVVIKDGGAAGTVKFEGTVLGAENYGGRSWVKPIIFDTDIYVDVTGTGASYIIEYE